MVLTHLILNGMIKVKGQLGEMAKCVEDPETRIADLAKLFFKELSGKDNAIYNNLPDSKIFFCLLLLTNSFFIQLLVISLLATTQLKRRNLRAFSSISSLSSKKSVFSPLNCRYVV